MCFCSSWAYSGEVLKFKVQGLRLLLRLRSVTISLGLSSISASLTDHEVEMLIEYNAEIWFF